MSECQESLEVDDDMGTLACWLPENHDGPHYDEMDNVTWKVGKPDE